MYIRSITGVPFNDISRQMNRENEMRFGQVFAISCRTGKVIWKLQSTTEDEFLGGDVCSCGDVDGDNVVDLVVSGWRDSECCLTAVSGATGSVIWRRGLFE